MSRKIAAIAQILIILIVLVSLSAFLLIASGKPLSKETLISPVGNSFNIFSLFNNKLKTNYKVYGFLPYWSLDNAKYLQLDKVTDIAYFGLNIDKEGNFIKVLEDGTADPGYNTWKNSERLTKIINDSKRQGVNFALTVISHTDETSDKFLDCKKCWETFNTSLIKELDSKGLKSVNLNFEYVEFTDPLKADQYTEFVKFVKNAMYSKYGDNSYVVVSTFADSLVKPRVTKIDGLVNAADAIFIMAYDFHRPDSDKAGPVAPIGGKDVIAEYDIDTMLKDYLSVSPPSKLILGVPYYGYNWVVQSSNPNSERIPGNDNIGFSQSQTYSAITDTIVDLKPKVLWDDLGKAPYFTYTSPDTGSFRQVYYENKESLELKYQLIKDKKLAGVGIWALGYDGGYTELWDLLKKEFYTQQ